MLKSAEGTFTNAILKNILNDYFCVFLHHILVFTYNATKTIEVMACEVVSFEKVFH